MRTARQHKIDKALARVLIDAAPYHMPEAALREEIIGRVIPRPTATEVDDSIRHADQEKRLVSVQADTGPKYTLSEIGQAWAAGNL